MMDIQSTTGDLMHQATETAGLSLVMAIKKIDEALGKGAAKDHPEIIAAFMKAASADFRTGLLAKAAVYAVDELCKAMSRDRVEA